MNKHLLSRYTSYLSSKGEKFSVVDGSIYRRYNNMIVPFGSITEDYSISNHHARELLNQLGGILIRSTNGNLSTNQNKDWYAVVCDDFVSIDELRSKLKIKGEIKRGLTNCEVKRIDPVYLSEKGFEIYSNALQAYKSVKISTSTREQFIQDSLCAQHYEDIVHYWGAFHKNELIAYCSNFLYDNVEVSYSTMKFNPKYLSLYPSYALFYEMNKYYLSENKIKFANAGFRSILHETSIQSYLTKKFNFKKMYLDLNIYYSPIFKFIISAIYPFRNSIGRIDKRLSAIMELEKIRRNSNE